MSGTVEGKELVPKGCLSIVWKYFKFRESDVNQNESYAKIVVDWCLLCKAAQLTLLQNHH